MPHRRKRNTTKIEIIQVATWMFLERGFTNTSIKAISDELDISTGNLTFHFPTKEHLLSVLVEMLCGFQWRMMERAADEGRSPLMAVCLELPAMAAICEENEIAKDFYLSAYTHTMSLDMIRRSDTQKAKQVFGAYCPNWKEEHFIQAEILVSGMEYATLMTTANSPSLDIRVAGALNSILMTYGVPEDDRRKVIGEVLAMDYRGIGRQILRDFTAYIEEVNEQALESLYQM